MNVANNALLNRHRGSLRWHVAPGSRSFGELRFSEIVIGVMLILTGLLDALQKVKLGAISANGLLTALYCLLVFLLMLMRGGISSKVLRILAPAFLFGFWALLAVFWTHSRSTEMIQPLTVLLSFIGALMLVSDMAERDNPLGFWFITLIPKVLAFASILLVASLALMGGLHVEDAQLAGRAYGIYASVGVMWLMAGWRIGERKNRLYVLIIIVIIAASLSRTTLVTCILAIPFMVFFRPRGLSSWIRPILMLIIVGAIAIVGILSVPALNKRFLSAGDRGLSVGGTSISTQGRAQIWAAVFKDAQQSPWIGHGPGSSSLYVAKVTSGVVKEPHNDYLRLFHDYGMVGVFLFLWLIYSLFKTIRKGYRIAERRNLLGAQRCIVSGLGVIVTVLICMLTDNILVYAQPMLLVAILLGAAVGYSLSLQARYA